MMVLLKNNKKCLTNDMNNDILVYKRWLQWNKLPCRSWPMYCGSW